MVDKLTLYFLSKRYRGDVLSLTIFMIGLIAMLEVVLCFFEITVLDFSQILQAALPASAVMVRCRGVLPAPLWLRLRGTIDPSEDQPS